MTGLDATLDASLGGIGGRHCAPAATGNIAAEDLVCLLQRSGCETGISPDRAIETGRWPQEELGRPVPGMLVKAGGFPRSASSRQHPADPCSAGPTAARATAGNPCHKLVECRPP